KRGPMPKFLTISCSNASTSALTRRPPGHIRLVPEREGSERSGREDGVEGVVDPGVADLGGADLAVEARALRGGEVQAGAPVAEGGEHGLVLAHEGRRLLGHADEGRAGDRREVIRRE